MTTPELTEEQVALVLADYLEVCSKLGYAPGTLPHVLVEHGYAQGAQVLALVPSAPERERVIARHLFLRGVA